MISLVGQVTLESMDCFLAVGGLIGYVKAGSRPSLIAGLLSAVAAFAALGLSIGKSQLAVALGLVLSIVLFILFGYRYAVKTGKFMPSGLLAVVSLIVLGVLILTVRLEPPAGWRRLRTLGRYPADGVSDPSGPRCHESGAVIVCSLPSRRCAP